MRKTFAWKELKEVLCRKARIGIPKRFATPILIAAVAKASCFWWIQRSINSRPDLFSCSSWWGMFTFWDGGWYNLIAEYWYRNIPVIPVIPAQQTFAFFPGFPAMIRALGLLIGDFTISQIIIATIFGFAWIPLFQLVAEAYLDKQQALSSSVIASLFPTVFLFTSVGYSEGFFLTLVLASWVLYLRKKFFLAALLGIGASLTRPVGVVVVIPMILDGVLRRQVRRVFLLASPVVAQVLWLFYGYVNTGEVFMVFEAQRYWLNRRFVSQYILPALFQANPPFSFSLPFTEAFVGLVICLVAISVLLIVKIFELDWKLGVYSSFTFLIPVLFGNIFSYPRYLSFIFPVWLLFRVKRPWMLLLLAFTLGFCDLIAVYLFARWVFLG